MFIFKGWVVAMVTLNSCKDMFEIGGSLNVQTAYLRNLWNIFVGLFDRNTQYWTRLESNTVYFIKMNVFINLVVVSNWYCRIIIAFI